MSGWLLFMIFVAIVCHPSMNVEGKGFAPFIAWSVAILGWSAVVLGLLAGALRTGGYL